MAKREQRAAKKRATKAPRTARATKAAAPAARRPSRVAVPKTCKMYVKGAFVRSEGGKVLEQRDPGGNLMAHYVRATRKDLRDAVLAARAAQPGWSGRSAFNRGQILFRLAEMLEDRRPVLVERLARAAGFSKRDADADVSTAADRVFFYAGFADKLAQVLGGINPVATPYFNFTLPDATGVVAIGPSRTSPLVGILSTVLPVILSGNTCVVFVDGVAPILASDLGEALATSDLPGGVVNLLTGRRDELLSHAADHMDVNAVFLVGGSAGERRDVRRRASENVKRVHVRDDADAAAWRDDSMQGLYWIEPFVEWKTAWHPIGV